jgi:hypothetical protein
MTKIIANILSILLLAALFIFPSRFLQKSTDKIVSLANDALNATLQEDWSTAVNAVTRMHDQLDKDRATMHLFLNHETVEELEAAVDGCVQLVRVQDKPQTVLELEFIITRARHLKSIEDFAISVLI